MLPLISMHPRQYPDLKDVAQYSNDFSFPKMIDPLPIKIFKM